MDETTPRPMPPVVCASRRTKPIDLKLVLEALSPEVQQQVLEDLLARMRREFSELWYPTRRRGVDETLTDRMRRSTDPVYVRLVTVLDAYYPKHLNRRERGESEAERASYRRTVLVPLVDVMRPRFDAWWKNSRDAKKMMEVGAAVLSDPQLRWLAAQYARTVFDYWMPERPESRGVMLASIEATEGYALGRVSYRQFSAAYKAALATAERESRASDAADEGWFRIADWTPVIAAEAVASNAAVRTVGRLQEVAEWNALREWMEDDVEQSVSKANEAKALAALADVARTVMALCPPALV